MYIIQPGTCACIFACINERTRHKELRNCFAFYVIAAMNIEMNIKGDS